MPICTGIAFDPAVWRQRIADARRGGMAAIVDGVMARFLAPSFIDAAPAIADGVRRMIRTTPVAGYAGGGGRDWTRARGDGW